MTTNRSLEARKFLGEERNLLAKNRFPTSREALSFIESLYAVGAVEVFIPSIRDFVSETEMYADEIRVTLPNKPEARQAIFLLVNGEMGHEGYSPVSDDGQTEVKLWWS